MQKYDGRLMYKLREFYDTVNDYYSSMEYQRELIKDKISELNKFRVEVSEKWHLNVLDDKRVVGVDGSQIMPLKEVGIPIGGIQVAKLVIIHGKGDYKIQHYSAFAGIEENISLLRFKMEIDALLDEMDGKSWLFFDGSLSSTFTADMSDRLREEYAESIKFIIKASKKTETPLIGYVDRSYAKDIAKNIGVNVYDSYLLNQTLSFMDYTEMFELEREEICFSYLKVNPGQPVRIECPLWMRDIQHEAASIVFAECLLGSTKGYPYVLERAHECSKISNEEKNDFRRLFSRDISFKWICKVK
jgi:hypothetical protein